MITEMEPKHIKQVAALHCQALPGDLLPSLGSGFLERVLYKSSLHSQYGKTFIFLEGETVGGFITIALDNRAFLKGVLRASIHWIVWYALTKALWDLTRLKEAWDAFLNSLGSREDAALPEIVVVAVGKEFLRRGVARKLTKTAMEYLVRKGRNECQTRTLSQNLAALKMYESAGFSKSHLERRGSKKYVVLRKGLSAKNEQA